VLSARLSSQTSGTTRIWLSSSLLRVLTSATRCTRPLTWRRSGANAQSAVLSEMDEAASRKRVAQESESGAASADDEGDEDSDDDAGDEVDARSFDDDECFDHPDLGRVCVLPGAKTCGDMDVPEDKATCKTLTDWILINIVDVAKLRKVRTKNGKKNPFGCSIDHKDKGVWSTNANGNNFKNRSSLICIPEPIPEPNNPDSDLEQFTPERSDWTNLDAKPLASGTNVDHSPDGIGWISRETWQEWDGTIINPEDHSRSSFADMICQGDTVRGIRTLFNDNEPFADNKNPTKAEVDHWHALALNHVRAMVGYTGDEYTARPDKCLHIRALWSDERHRSRMWDADYPDRTCLESSNPHCGAAFVPSLEDQQPYLPDGIESCPHRGGGSEAISPAAKSNIPWSIRWIRPLCGFLKSEGFWGGHTGGFFHRPLFGWDWWEQEPDNANTNVILRAKWSGTHAANPYVNPELVNRLVRGAAARYNEWRCDGIQWGSPLDTADLCYERMLADDNCGKRFMTYNAGNFGCACYPPDLTSCVGKREPFRLTWDFVPSPPDFGGFRLSDTMVFENLGRCQDIQWKFTAGDDLHCLQTIIEANDPECGTKFITWNALGGGCACYPPEQTTCTRVGEPGRQTWELVRDPAFEP